MNHPTQCLKKELDQLRQNYTKQKSCAVLEMLECEGTRIYKTGSSVEKYIRKRFPHRRSLAKNQILEEIKTGKLFRYAPVQRLGSSQV